MLFLGPRSLISMEGLHTWGVGNGLESAELSQDRGHCTVSGQISACTPAAQSSQSVLVPYCPKVFSIPTSK